MDFYHRQREDPYPWCQFSPVLHLLVDLGHNRLVDSLTQLSVNGIQTKEQSPSRTLLPKELRTEYENLLAEFPSLLQPCIQQQAVKHSVRHHITTTGPPLSARAQCLPPEKLTAARQEFDHMIELGIVRPSASSWASPLHMVPK